MFLQNCYKDFLKSELQRRQERNPGYSLRAFARDLKVPVSRLSVVINKKGRLSSASALSITQRLQLSHSEKAQFLALVGVEHPRSESIRKASQQALKKLAGDKKFKSVHADVFKIILDWYHFAILELAEMHDFKSDEKWIAQRLDISTSQAQAAVKRLIRHKLLTAQDKQWVRSKSSLSIESEIPSREMLHYHRQVLARADQSLQTCAREERDFSAVTFAFREDQMPQARQMLKDFRRSLMEKFEVSENKDRVYCLSLQFFPLDKKLDKKKESL